MQPWSDNSRSGPPLVRPADLAACRAALRNGSRSFLAASHLLPTRVRDDAIALYAFCRVADDAIDQEGGASALGPLHARLEAAYAGAPMDIPADRALADLVARRDIPMELPAALLEGFAWDAEVRRYEDISALSAYAVRVAGSVGAMMALLMDARAPETVARACDLGVAMQLSNIARDVGEDARAGRLYLPLDWLRAAGIDPDRWLARPVFNAALASVVRRLLEMAETFYRRADAGIRALPRSCRLGIGAARVLYAEIGHEVARNGYDSVSARAVVSGRRKLAKLAGLALTPPVTPQTGFAVLPEAAFLVDAVAGASARTSLGRSAEQAASRPGERLIWLIDLFTQLERRAQVGPASP
jgi:phytoene synthase